MYSTREISELAGRNIDTVRRHINSGVLKAEMVDTRGRGGFSYKIRKKDALEYIEKIKNKMRFKLEKAKNSTSANLVYLSRRTDIPVPALRELISSGELPAYKNGREFRVRRDDVNNFIMRYQSGKYDHLVVKKEKPERFYQCSGYERCLMAAAREGVNFNCKECKSFVQAKRFLSDELHTINGCIAMWKEVFGKELIFNDIGERPGTKCPGRARRR